MRAGSPSVPATTADIARQATVIASAVLALTGSAIGSGAFGGTPIAEAGDGALSASSTLVAPDGPAFAIWGVVYAGLLALAVWQVLPSHRADERQRATGWWTAASLLLNAAWILTARAGHVAASVAVIAALLVVLVVVVGRLTAAPGHRGRLEVVLVDGTMGLYLGWVSIATVANTAAALKQAGLTTGEPAWAVGVLAVAAGIGVLTAARTRGSLGFGAGLAWGLGWVAAGRTTGPATSTVVAVTAGVAAAVVVASTVAAKAGLLRLGRRR
ncbi:tryptophan-rich sensory protein [Kineosporiaceae bacterium B12]|nr:tryptophan-rich sensory protein [Kineococcus rubinsiae]